VHDGEREDPIAEPIALAVAAVREQQNTLQTLFDQVRSTSAARLAEQRKVREELSSLTVHLAELEGELAQRRSSELAIEVMALRERLQALRQQELQLGEQIEAQAKQCQRLQIALSESEGIAVMLTTRGPLRDGEGLLGSTSWRVAQAQEEERERLAREIHDGPAQALANGIFEIEFCLRLMDRDPVKLRLELVRLKDDLRQSLADVRHFIFGLRPAVLSELGLLATVRRYAEDYQARCGITVSIDAVEPVRLTANQEVAIFRIIQEALQNARKHGKASSVALGFHLEAGQLKISIADDGEGFDVAEAKERSVGHFGLRGMLERARLIGAELTVTSKSDAGTTVTLIVPQDSAGNCR
jgi:two-component system sensor histidine kinase DegS